MAMIFYAHSGLRYLVLLAGVAALVYLAVGLARGKPFDKAAGGLTGAYVGLMDLQVLLGVILWLMIPGYPALMGHIVLMLAAVTAAHMANIANKRRPERSWAVALTGVVLSLLLIVAGIMAIGRPIFGSGAPTV